MSLYPRLRTFLFRLDPEQAHRLTLRLLALAGRLSPARALLRRAFEVRDPALEARALGLTFPNPLGLAAGYDKDGVALRGLACLGFGHIEVGTVTPEPQPGNPRPRLFRLPESEALINRMGFPNQGAAALAERLGRWRPREVIVGVNLGKNAATPLERAVEDYERLVARFHGLVDYLVVNVSSPNTPGLRSLEAGPALAPLLARLLGLKRDLDQEAGACVPLLLKLSPDLSPRALEATVEMALTAGVDGLILTNTTVQRPRLRSPLAAEAGGLSGRPLAPLALEALRRARRVAGEGFPIIAVGGIMGPEEARRRLEAGATLLQLYTGLAYHGPGLVRRILLDLRRG